MMAENQKWSPDKEAALKALIRATIDSAGPIAPELLPHKVKTALQDQASGAVDIDRLIKQVLKEMRES